MHTEPPGILAADIGGTSSRFAVFSDQAGRLRLDKAASMPTRLAGSLDELLELLRQSPLRGLLPGCLTAVLAVAGAVQDGKHARLPNIPWEVDLRGANLTGLPERVTLINDFAAQAYGCKTEAVKQALVIHRGRPTSEGPLAVVGAGTGLGHGLLLTLQNKFLAMPSEAGHMAFSFVGQDERDYERFLLERTGQDYAHGDAVVSGRGLALLHAYHHGQETSPALAAAALNPDSPVLAWFARFYGRACRQFVLATLSTGGLYVSGGIAAKNTCLVTAPEFMAEFVRHPAHSPLLQSIPVALNTNENCGLWGAALCALHGLETG